MIEIIKSGLKKRKVKLFFGFLLCSFLAWFVSNLSESYMGNTIFELNFIDVPEDKMLVSTSKVALDVKLEAVGFQFLRFNFNNKTVDIDLTKVEKANGKYFITPSMYRQQIEKQLSNSMRLLQIPNDTLFIDFQDVITKTVAVEPLIEMSFEQNYILDGIVEVEPSTIQISGPMNEIDSITVFSTPKIELKDLSSDFSKTTFIIKPDSLYNSSFSTEQVTIKGKVSRFSEKIIEVPIQVLNLPENMTIRMFPDKVKVLCKAKMSDLKNLSSADFTIVVDYLEVVGGNERSDKLTSVLQKKPKNIFNATLVQNKIEYILKKK